jgi:hypothetical protein
MDKKIIGLIWLLFGGVLFLYKCYQVAKYTENKNTITLLWGLSVGCLLGLLVDMALLVMSCK